MKKAIFFALAILAALSSCNKIEEQPAPQTGGVRVFTAVINQSTKTTIAIDGNAGKIKWESSDFITVTDNSSNSAIYDVTDGAGTSAATFTIRDGQTALGSGPYTAVYGVAPSTSTAQSYNPEKGSSAAMYMTASATETTALKFDAQCGVMKLNLTDASHSVTKIEVSDGTNEFTMNCTEAVSISGGRDFFIALPEATYTSVKVTASDNSVATKSSVILQVQTNHVKPVNATNLNFASAPTEIYYDSNSGEWVAEYPGNSFTLPSMSTTNAIELPSINWSNGDYLELSIHIGDANGKIPFIIGNAKALASPYGNDGCYSLFINESDWPTLQNRNSGATDGTFSVAKQRPADITMKISNGKVDSNGSLMEDASWTHSLTIQSSSVGTLYVASGNSATCDYIKITRGNTVHATEVTLSQLSANLTVGGESVTLTASVTPANSTDSVEWSSNDESVATVSGGVVTPVAAGTATITATAGTVHADCTVTVSAAAPIAVTGITLDKNAINLTVGETDTLTPTVLPANADNKNVTWYSPDPSVANVVDGVVTAVGAGSVSIQCISAENMDKYAICTVTVSAAPAPTPTGITYYVDSSGTHSETPVSFAVSGDGYCIDLTKDEFDLSAGDELEIMFTHNGKDSRFLCLGNKSHYNTGTSPGWGGCVIYFETSNNNVWFSFKNSNNSSLANTSFNRAYLNQYSSGVKITADKIQYYMKETGGEFQWVDAADPSAGDSVAAILAKFKECTPFSIGSYGTFNQEVKSQITSIKITKASIVDGGVDDSTTGDLTTGTVIGW